MACSEDHPVQHQVRGTRGLVKVDISATAVVGGEAKDDTHPLDRLAGDARILEVSFDELDPLRIQGTTIPLRDLKHHSGETPPGDSPSRWIPDRLGAQQASSSQVGHITGCGLR